MNTDLIVSALVGASAGTLTGGVLVAWTTRHEWARGKTAGYLEGALEAARSRPGPARTVLPPWPRPEAESAAEQSDWRRVYDELAPDRIAADDPPRPTLGDVYDRLAKVFPPGAGSGPASPGPELTAASERILRDIRDERQGLAGRANAVIAAMQDPKIPEDPGKSRSIHIANPF